MCLSGANSTRQQHGSELMISHPLSQMIILVSRALYFFDLLVVQPDLFAVEAKDSGFALAWAEQVSAQAPIPSSADCSLLKSVSMPLTL